MGLIKKQYSKIITYGLIALGIIALCVVFFFHLKTSSYWIGIFLIVVGLTLLPLIKGQK